MIACLSVVLTHSLFYSDPLGPVLSTFLCIFSGCWNIFLFAVELTRLDRHMTRCILGCFEAWWMYGNVVVLLVMVRIRWVMSSKGSLLPGSFLSVGTMVFAAYVVLLDAAVLASPRFKIAWTILYTLAWGMPVVLPFFVAEEWHDVDVCLGFCTATASSVIAACRVSHLTFVLKYVWHLWRRPSETLIIHAACSVRVA